MEIEELKKSQNVTSFCVLVTRDAPETRWMALIYSYVKHRLDGYSFFRSNTSITVNYHRKYQQCTSNPNGVRSNSFLNYARASRIGNEPGICIIIVSLSALGQRDCQIEAPLLVVHRKTPYYPE